MSQGCLKLASATCLRQPEMGMKMPAKWDLIFNQSANFVSVGVDGMLERIPEGARYYLTIDIDGFDPSIASGTGTPSHGGFLYYEILEFLDGLSKRGDIVGVDLVEVAPDYDLSGCTTTLAAQILLNLIGESITIADLDVYQFCDILCAESRSDALEY